jgi:hypothetical protein
MNEHPWMKNHFAALSLTGLIGLAPHALAASADKLTVKGLITPLACTPRLSNSGLVEFGKIPRRDLNVDKRTRLRDQALDFSIQCSAPGRFALRMRDDREGSAITDSQIYYGLNYDGSGNKIGLYKLNFNPENTVVDDLSQVFSTDSTTGGAALEYIEQPRHTHCCQELSGLHRQSRKQRRPDRHPPSDKPGHRRNIYRANLRAGPEHRRTNRWLGDAGDCLPVAPYFRLSRFVPERTANGRHRDRR